MLFDRLEFLPSGVTNSVKGNFVNSAWAVSDSFSVGVVPSQNRQPFRSFFYLTSPIIYIRLDFNYGNNSLGQVQPGRPPLRRDRTACVMRFHEHSLYTVKARFDMTVSHAAKPTFDSAFCVYPIVLALKSNSLTRSIR
jgi:hypothetical protein